MSTGRGGGGAVDIPASTKKVVQDLKEVVGNSEEEIYAMLKECNMDPNEAAQRLLNQGDPFHEVKRKRDKKKETGGMKARDSDMRGRPGSGGYIRGGGRGGGGTGGSLPRYGSQGSQEYGGGRGRAHGRENGIHPGLRGSSAASNSTTAPCQAKPSAPSSVPPSTGAQTAAAAAAAAPVQAPSPASSSSGGAVNGSSGFVRPARPPQGAWASGHGTMADLLKARAAPPPPPSSFQSPATSPAVPVVQTALSPSYPAAVAPVAASEPSPESSGFYSSSADPVLHTSVDLRVVGGQSAIGAVGNQRPIGDRPVSSSNAEAAIDSSAASPSAQASSVPESEGSGDLETDMERELETARPPSPPAATASAPSSRDVSVDEAAVSMEAGNSQGHGSMSVLGGSQFNGRPLYGSPQQPVGTQKAAGAGGLEWKAKAPGHNLLGSSADGGSQGLGAVDPTSIAQAYQSMSIQEDEPVIIPTHLRVPEADRSHLSFGSFGSDFVSAFGTSFGHAEVEENKKNVETIAVEEAPVELPAPSSVDTQVEMAQSYGLQQVATPVESIDASVEAPPVVQQDPAVPAQEQHTKPDPVVQSAPYFFGASNYPGFGLMPQMPGGQYGYEQTESAPQDAPRIPSMVPAYDPTTSYYTSAFRGAESDRLYPPYVPTNTASKYSGNIGLMAAPSLQASQEGGNPMLASATPSVSSSQTSQPGSNVQPAQVVPQQALPMHYSQPPSGPFGNYVSYQYMPASYPYLQPPYPHHVYNSSSTAYAQPPAGSTYTPPSAASSYPAGGATAVKFPMPQYKPGAAAGNAPHPAPAVGYGGYTTTPSGYASSPAVTVGNASGYEDMNTSRYKDSTLYIPSQQGDSSTVWIQAAMPRDIGPSAAMQTSLYYSLAGQGQHSGYAHSQQPTHGHAHPNAAYTNLYHPSQTGPAPSHQMLQQPQGMGGAGGNSQAGAYQQQPQRAQQSWNNSNY
ncbi:uncharacterized protein [Physcomitrium patens]|uniref:GBF-interacting protein 1 N-terminal domain-containing protein n=2 Tax=Physcomitrium patens TaxID=3218 RepID=A0A2K1K2L4_PHYPA|nr:AT-rich interactive domain-containing protein 1A-like isoform X2 [Physcomitrium patens]PNR48019.1 hypothetical protein PHYPA_012492 [Physcomitrium patens]|eukprot:XP_024384604.1 AT-rich interactive domain-containing protein 1A-like isoform X2 [Physcomitrella patens]